MAQNVNCKRVLQRQGGVTTWEFGRIPAIATDDNAGNIFIATACRPTGADLKGGVLNKIGFMKSTDAGGTFTPLTVVLDKSSEGVGFDDPSITIDTDTGRIYIAAISTYGLAAGQFPQLTDAPMVMIWSDDGGVTWTEPLQISSPFTTQVCSSGNGIYINSLSRVVFPCYGIDPNGGYAPFFMYTDDDGVTWNFSSQASFNSDNDGECRVIYDNGRYWLISRIDLYKNRGVYFSDDDGATWTEDPERSRQLKNLGINFGTIMLDGVTYYASCDIDGSVGEKRGDVTYRYGMEYITSNDLLKTQRTRAKYVPNYRRTDIYFGYSCIAVNSIYSFILYESENLDSLSLIRIRRN